MKSFRLLAAATAAALLAACSFSPAQAFAANGLTADITAGISGSYAGSNDLAAVSSLFRVQALMRLQAGTGTGKADLVYSKTRTIAASSSESLDLNAGGLLDIYGTVFSPVKVKAIYILAHVGNTNQVCFGGAASNTFLGPFKDATDVHCIDPGGFELVTTPVGWTVTASTADLLKVANSSSGTGVTYDIIIVGASA